MYGNLLTLCYLVSSEPCSCLGIVLSLTCTSQTSTRRFLSLMAVKLFCNIASIIKWSSPALVGEVFKDCLEKIFAELVADKGFNENVLINIVNSDGNDDFDEEKFGAFVF